MVNFTCPPGWPRGPNGHHLRVSEGDFGQEQHLGGGRGAQEARCPPPRGREPAGGGRVRALSRLAA